GRVRGRGAVGGRGGGAGAGRWGRGGRRTPAGGGMGGGRHGRGRGGDRPRLPPRPANRRRRGDRGRELASPGHRDAGASRGPSGIRLGGGGGALLRRRGDGLVDDGDRAARGGSRDLHGVSRAAGGATGESVPARTWRAGAGPARIDRVAGRASAGADGG